eukprot:PhM_4_TR6491/c0_g1_i1/m.61603
MRNDVHLGAVTGQHRGADEREARVLHAAVRERLRKHEHIVATPFVRPHKALGDANVLLNLHKVVADDRLSRGLAVDGAAGTELCADKVARGDCDKVRRKGLGLLEARDHCVAHDLGALRQGRHDNNKVLGCADLRRVGAADPGRILAGQHRARVDGLALREQERQRAAVRLLRRHPAQRGAVRRGHVRDSELQLSHTDGRRQLDRERRAEGLCVLSDGVHGLHVCTVGAEAEQLNEAHVESTRVEDDHVGGADDRRCVRHGAHQEIRGELQHPVEVHVADTDVIDVGIRAFVPRRLSECHFSKKSSIKYRN